MKKILPIIISLFLVSCGVQKPIKEEIRYTYRDSVVVSKIDSTVIIPVERIVDIVADYDTLHLETSLAEADAWVDSTNHILRGKIENKSTFSQQIKYVDRIEYRDSIVFQRIPEPYPVEKVVRKNPKMFSFLLGWFILSFILIVVYILRKLKII